MSKKKGKSVRKLIVGGAVFVFIIITLILASTSGGKPIPHGNPIDLTISQHSGKYITQNAITTHPQFKKIAFEAPPKLTAFSGQFASAFESLRLFVANILGLAPKETGPKEYGSWIWTPIMQMTPEYVESVLAGAESNGVNVMYVSIDSYLDIFVMEEGAEKEILENKFSSILEDFITRANGKGIEVDAEAGWQNWAEEGNEYKAFAVIDYIKKFNAGREAKFRGFQYDIEPYLLDSYKKDPVSVLSNFTSLVDKTEYFIGTDPIKFSVVIPDFYDKKDGATPKFSHNSRSDYVLGHLIKILDRRLGSSVIIMSYRNFAEGKDGAIEVSQNEMGTAGRGARNTKIIIAQETGEVPPPYITFHNTSKEYFSGQVAKINNKFISSPKFGGIAVHYINAYLALK